MGSAKELIEFVKKGGCRKTDLYIQVKNLVGNDYACLELFKKDIQTAMNLSRYPDRLSYEDEYYKFNEISHQNRQNPELRRQYDIYATISQFKKNLLW